MGPPQFVVLSVDLLPSRFEQYSSEKEEDVQHFSSMQLAVMTLRYLECDEQEEHFEGRSFGQSDPKIVFKRKHCAIHGSPSQSFLNGVQNLYRVSFGLAFAVQDASPSWKHTWQFT